MGPALDNDPAGEDDSPGSEPDRDRELGEPTSGLCPLDVDDVVGNARVSQVEGNDDVAFHGRVGGRESNPGLAEGGRQVETRAEQEQEYF